MAAVLDALRAARRLGELLGVGSILFGAAIDGEAGHSAVFKHCASIRPPGYLGMGRKLLFWVFPWSSQPGLLGRYFAKSA
jgi:hypothetical protein